MKFVDYLVAKNNEDILKFLETKDKQKNYIVVDGARYPIVIGGDDFKYEDTATLYLIFSVNEKINQYYVRGLFEEKILNYPIPVYVYKNMIELCPFDRMNEFEGRLKIDKNGEYIDTPLFEMINGLIHFEYCEKLSSNCCLIVLGS